MASSSSSAARSLLLSQKKYDVFLSFRGEDTRRTFTAHLYEYLRNRGIFIFQDDKRLQSGGLISEELFKAIEESKVAVICFSKNYASSRWCLDELVKIMECRDRNGQIVMPVFYHVDSSHVRHQSVSFAESFVQHDLRYGNDVVGRQKVRGWRNALTGAANLKGFHIQDQIDESDVIQHIVDEISRLLKSAYFLYSSKDVVGLDTHLEIVESILNKETNGARIVGIWGMGGIGKTTIATIIFHKYNLSGKFKAACFLDDVKDNANENGLCSLQNILFSQLLGEKHNYITSKQVGKEMIPRRLGFMKVLIVLDDIDRSDHLEYLAGDASWFGKGSVVIVTTRNRDVLKIDDDAIYEVQILPEDAALQLFNRHAFKNKDPDESFKKLSLEVVDHAKGLPLALKVWGGSLYKKDLSRWKIIIDKIKKTSTLDIVEKLKISSDGLEPQVQKIFLDMACFFRGYEKEKVIQILESCDFGARYGLDVLIDKSLVYLADSNTIEMHDLIEDMGRYVVKMHNDSGELSRIWDAKDFEQVMLNNIGMKATEAIWINGDQKLCFSKKAMKKMKRLRILNNHGFHTHSDSIEYLPNNLRWFGCDGYAQESLPENFEPKSLVHLELNSSLLRHLWTGTKFLPYLTTLDLSQSKMLLKTPDFTRMTNLKNLNLSYCRSLEEVHHSLGCCRKLIQLHLKCCERLERFPYINVESLEYLNLENCSSLEKFPDIKLELETDQIQAPLTELDLRCLKKLVTLPSSISMLKGLLKLDVSSCSKLESLPEEIGDLDNLEKLNASLTLISRPPSSIVRLNKLKALDLSYCNLIDGGLPEDVGCLSSLKELNLVGNNFEHLPRSIAQLGALRYLDLRECKRLRQLPKFPKQLDKINAEWSNDWMCNSLFQNISPLQRDSSASHSLSLGMLTSSQDTIPSWFHHWGSGTSVSVNLSENWYIRDNFLGFAVCYRLGFVSSRDKSVDITVKLIPLCDDGMLSMTHKLALSNHSEDGIHFLLAPLSGLWDASKANGKTPNHYGCIRFSFSQEMEEFGFRLVYKDEAAEHSIGTKRRNDEDSEHVNTPLVYQRFTHGRFKEIRK